MLLLYRGETLDGHGLLVDDDKALTAFKTTTANAADARKISKTSTPCTKLSVQPHGWGKRAARTEKVQCTASKLGKIHREGIISAWDRRPERLQYRYGGIDVRVFHRLLRVECCSKDQAENELCNTAWAPHFAAWCRDNRKDYIYTMKLRKDM